jgi:GNAT superfamily N-acetyltransferase
MQNVLAVLALEDTFAADQALARVADAVEGLAWRDMILGAPAWLVRASGAVAEVIEDAVVMSAPGVDHLLFNRTVGLGLYEPALESSIVRILKRYKSLGIGHYWIHVNPFAQPANFSRLLAKRGLQPYRRSWVKMMRPAGTIGAPIEALTVRPAVARDAPLVGSIVGPAFDLPQLGAEFFAHTVARPRWHVMLVEHMSQPIAAAGMFVDGEFAYFAFAATRPEFRGLGAQRALMHARAELAMQLGCKWLVTETGFPITADEPSPSYHNMLWAGFRAVAVRENFCPPGTVWATQAHSL